MAPQAWLSYSGNLATFPKWPCLSKQLPSLSIMWNCRLHTNVWVSLEIKCDTAFQCHTWCMQWFRTTAKYGNIHVYTQSKEKQSKKKNHNIKSKLNFQRQIWMMCSFVHTENMKFLLVSVSSKFCSSVTEN